ncbi:hypothetical protein HRbin06_00920 [archaeon HR06]|nr:hypothetical protein HRbin06_00920 [archaeon HR06]
MVTFKPNFWNSTLIGKLIPLEFYQYTDGRSFVGQEYKQGYIPIYIKKYKFGEDSPLKLVFESSSLKEELPVGGSSIFAGVLIYELVK